MHDRHFKLAAHQHQEHHTVPGDEHDGHKFEVLLFGLQPERIEQHLCGKHFTNNVGRYFLGNWQGLPEREADPQRIKLVGTKLMVEVDSRRTSDFESSGSLTIIKGDFCASLDERQTGSRGALLEKGRSAESGIRPFQSEPVALPGSVAPSGARCILSASSPRKVALGH